MVGDENISGISYLLGYVEHGRQPPVMHSYSGCNDIDEEKEKECYGKVL